jgi:hypothetical protein
MEQTDSNTTTPAPTSMAEAFASVDAAASSAATPTTDAQTSEPTPAAAIAQPEAETQPADSASTETTGEPPKWRWQDILANARETSAKEAEARLRQEIEQQYGWAKEFQQDELQGVVTWARALKSDPVAALKHLQATLEADARYAAALKPQQADSEPEPDLQAPDGTLVYSAPQQKKRDEWLMRQLKQQLSQEFQPLRETADQLKAREQADRQKAEQMRWAADVFAPIKRMPYFEEVKADLAKALSEQANSLTAEQLREFVWDTYATLHKAKLESKAKQSESQVLANLQQRAVAATANPAAASATTPKRPRTMAEALEMQGA